VPNTGGIDLGGTKIQAVVRGRRSAVLGQARVPTPRDGDPKAVIDAVGTALEAACVAAGCEPASLEGVGVGAPGPIDPERGVLEEAPNVAGFDRPFPLAARIAKRTGVSRVVLGNDVTVAITAEYALGAGRGRDSVLGVWVGTGIGGGLILHGRPWAGRGAAGEIGHTVIKRGGARCFCGRQGCLEAYAGRKAMEARARHEFEQGRHTDLFQIQKDKGRPVLTSGVWAEAVSRGDGLAMDLVERQVRALGVGIGSVQNLLDVELVIIGGGMGDRFGAPYIARIVEEMRPHLLQADNPPKVVGTELGDLGGALGASLLVEPVRTRASARKASASKS
jgi:glucokinase